MMHQRRSGLGSLIPGAELSAGSAPMLVPIATITTNPYQPRRIFAPEALDELAESIRQHGILQPLTVRPRGDGYELIAGERRLQAARKAGMTSVPVIVRGCTDMEMLELALVENLQREDLNAMEAAHSYQQLVSEFGLSHGQVAERVGKSRSAVANTLRLLSLPEPVQQGVEDNAISEGHARALLSLEEPERQVALFKETVERGWSVRALEAQVSRSPRHVSKKPKEKKDGADPHLMQIRSELQLLLGTRVVFKTGSDADSGAIEIDYYSSEDLARILEILQK
ncbi:MAG: ParB/RepB/Spo0J family partition protein [Armatimonadota bacterium]